MDTPFKQRYLFGAVPVRLLFFLLIFSKFVFRYSEMNEICMIEQSDRKFKW